MIRTEIIKIKRVVSYYCVHIYTCVRVLLQVVVPDIGNRFSSVVYTHVQVYMYYIITRIAQKRKKNDVAYVYYTM